MLDLPAAWQITRGAGVTVAIVDSGARLDHADLGRNIWTNFDETPGNGVDDDHNGYVDDVHGIDLTSKQRGQDLRDGNGHGTHVAGIVAAAANGRGVVGVAPQAKLMIVKVLDDDGGRHHRRRRRGHPLRGRQRRPRDQPVARRRRARPRLADAVEAAADANVLVVASAGNSGRDIDKQPPFRPRSPRRTSSRVAATEPSTAATSSDVLQLRPADRAGRRARRRRSSPPANDGGYELRAAPRWPPRWSPASPRWPPA